MKTVVIVQARVTSSRLPGKVLMDLAGRPMLAQQLRRLKRCHRVDEIVVATTTNDKDDPVVALANLEQMRWFRGSERDVLSRYVAAARESRADVVIRITADCPLIDPETTDRVIQELLSYASECDYASNVLKRTFPRGLDVEAFFLDTLERIGRLGKSSLAREHVTFFLRNERPDLFLVRSVTDVEDNSDLRWVVDTAEDMVLIRRLYKELGLAERVIPYRDLLLYVRSHPGITKINAHVRQKECTEI